MGAYKQFTTQDVIITPFNVKKGFKFLSNEFTSSEVSIDRFIGKNITGSLFSPLTSSSEPLTGFNQTQYQRLIYNSIKQLYYTNSIPDPIPTSSYLVDTTNVHSRFDNYLQSPSLDTRTFPSGNNAEIGVIAIPSRLYGNTIHPGSFRYEQNYIAATTESLIFSASSNLFGPLFVTELTVGPLTSSTDIFSGLTYLDFSSTIISQSGYLVNQIFSSSLNITGSLNITFTGSGSPTTINLYLCKGTGNTPSTLIYSSSFTTSVSGITSGSIILQQLISSSVNENYSLFFSNIGNDVTITSSFSIYTSAVTQSYTSSVFLYDDGEGNIYNNLDNNKCGNIIYPHGIITITSGGFHKNLTEFTTGSGVTCSFSSSMTIYETQYKCTLRENEFNFSLNPSLISGSEGLVYDFVTGSNFTPYITTIGLYNENQDLLAVAKLSNPLNSSDTTDTTILINMDK